MTLGLSLVSTERALPRPARNARQGWATRAACIITLTGEDGARGSGEASPLPGFSPDSLSDCQAALSRLDTRNLPSRLEPGRSIAEALASVSGRLPASLPAARSALECALLDLWARAAGKPAWVLIGAPNQSAPAPRTVAALLQGEPESACEQAQAAYARGQRCFKLKVGRPHSLPRELAAARQLRAELGPHVRLRLDANQSFSAEQARACLLQFAALNIEFIEEPCTPYDLACVPDLPLPLALDESLVTLASTALPLRVRALVLKPGLLGGVSACIAWAEAARRIGAEVIVSHTFDGPLGLMLSAALALSIGSETFAQGLDLHGAGLEGLALPGYSHGQVQAWSAPGLGALELAP